MSKLVTPRTCEPVSDSRASDGRKGKKKFNDVTDILPMDDLLSSNQPEMRYAF